MIKSVWAKYLLAAFNWENPIFLVCIAIFSSSDKINTLLCGIVGGRGYFAALRKASSRSYSYHNRVAVKQPCFWNFNNLPDLIFYQISHIVKQKRVKACIIIIWNQFNQFLFIVVDCRRRSNARENDYDHPWFDYECHSGVTFQGSLSIL